MTMIPRIDKRRLRAQAIVHHILQIVSKHLSDEDYRRNAIKEIHHSLMELCVKEGIEILTDYTRTDMGLPQRGPDGWTVEEIIALEKRHLDMMYSPLTMTVSQR